MTPYHYESYRLFLRDAVESMKKHNSALNYTRLAKEMGIQKSYLSQVLSGKCHLNSDQLFRAAKILGLCDDEIAFLELLLECDRTTIEERKLLLNRKRLEWSNLKQVS